MKKIYILLITLLLCFEGWGQAMFKKNATYENSSDSINISISKTSKQLKITAGIINGKWQYGLLSQNGSQFKYTKYEIYLSSIDNTDEIEGKMYLELEEGSYVWYQISGTFINNTLNYTTKSIIDEKRNGVSEWCIGVQYTLNYSIENSKIILKGKFYGCQGGQVYFEKSRGINIITPISGSAFIVGSRIPIMAELQTGTLGIGFQVAIFQIGNSQAIYAQAIKVGQLNNFELQLPKNLVSGDYELRITNFSSQEVNGSVKVNLINYIDNLTVPAILATGFFTHANIIPLGQEINYKISDKFPSTLTLKMPDVGNQNPYGSCGTWAIAYAAGSYLKALSSGKEGIYDNKTLCSPTQMFNAVRNSNGVCDKVEAPNLPMEDLLEFIRNIGVLPFSSTQYKQNDLANCTRFVGSDLFKADYKILRRLDFNINTFKFLLNNKTPIIIGIRVDQGFQNIPSPENGKPLVLHNGELNFLEQAYRNILGLDTYKRDSKYIWASKIGNIVGGHAMVICGYDDTKKAFKLMNSWGSDWGENGFGWIDYDFLFSGFNVKNIINFDNNMIFAAILPSPTLIKTLALTPQEENSLTIFPNPTINQFSIDLKDIEGKAQSLTIIDEKGTIIAQKAIDETCCENMQIDFPQTGVYSIIIQTDKGTVSKKININK